MKKSFTTGNIARICRVTINTVVKWFDSGELKGYRIPSSRARRVKRKDLLAFMKNNKTECALRLFESDVDLSIPDYIENAIRS